MFASILSFFKPQRMSSGSLDPALVILDPNARFTPNGLFLLFKGWASLPPSGTTTEEILSRFKVEKVTHFKLQNRTEHEYLVVEVGGGLGKTNRFVLDRMAVTVGTGPGDSMPVPQVEVDFFARLKKCVASLLIVASASSSETSPGPNISSADKSSLSLTETASFLSDSLNLSDDRPAYDRFMGECTLTGSKLKDGMAMRSCKPQNLTLFKLVVLSQAVYKLYPTYSLLKEQCYFFAGIVFAAVKQNWYVRPSDSAEEKEETAEDIDSPNCGTWKGLKVNMVDPQAVPELIDIYDQLYSTVIAEVFLLLLINKIIT
jgi:hypothetical protein